MSGGSLGIITITCSSSRARRARLFSSGLATTEAASLKHGDYLNTAYDGRLAGLERESSLTLLLLSPPKLLPSAAGLFFGDGELFLHLA